MKVNVVRIDALNMLGNTNSPPRIRACGLRSRVLTQDEAEQTETLLTLYSNNLRGTCCNAESTVAVAIGALRCVCDYIGLPPWEWTEQDISDFLVHKVIVDGIGIGRQATYITYLRGFQNYVHAAPSLRNGIHIKFGVQFPRFVSDENAIPIKRKRHARQTKVQVLTANESQKLIAQFDIDIRHAKLFGIKSYQSLRRNKVMALVLLMTGIRVEELVNLCTGDFDPDPSYPNFGDFSLLTVVKGKGNKQRVVRLYNPMIKSIMEWYLNEVRPYFLSPKTSKPDRLFLSERGCDLVPEQVRRMLANISSNAGIVTKVGPHILRHTYATLMKEVIGPEALQKQLGHEHLSTTLSTYYHQDPLKVGNQVREGIESFTNAIDEMTKGL